jgi:hypothetical protein
MYYTGMETTKTSNRIQAALTNHRATVEACCTELAINFDCPAKQIIGFYAAKMGISIPEWDQVIALRNGW